jgi:hypothetical protein
MLMLYDFGDRLLLDAHHQECLFVTVMQLVTKLLAL